MSTSNLFDIPDFYRKKLNVNFKDVESESVMECSEEVSAETLKTDEEEMITEHEEVIVKNDLESEGEPVLDLQSCKNGNCAPPPPPVGGCRGRNCPPPPPMPRFDGNNFPPPPRAPYPQYAYHPCLMGTFCRKGENMMPPMPFFKAHPGSLRMQEEMEDLQDFDRLQERYPINAKIIKMLVDEQADRMDYDGSMIFDEAPDRVHIEKIVDEIYNRFLKEMSNGRADKEMLEGECESCNNPIDERVIKELIMVLLYQEMFRRRCKNRRCNRWW